MKEYSYHSKRSNNSSTVVSGIFFGIAVLLFASTTLFSDIPFSGAIQLSSAVFFSISVLILTRYVFKSYLIRVFEVGNGNYDLTVTDCRGKNGKNQATVCRVSLCGIEKVIIKTEKTKDEIKERAKGRKVFSYCPDLRPEKECCIFLTECGSMILVHQVALRSLRYVL